MRHSPLYLSLIALLFAFGCQKSDPNQQVVSKRYIHKYGYEMSEKEWKAKDYPGQVISTLRSGVTIAASYEDGVLTGPCTHTFPHSQTIQTYYLYNKGNLVKEISYDIRGLPLREDLYVSPTRIATTQWYADGRPRATEEFENRLLVEGEYFTLNNETESRVQSGKGTRTIRSPEGLLLMREEFNSGKLTKRSEYHPNGTPHRIADYRNGQLHGLLLVYAPTGEPLSIEELRNGSLEGKAVYFQNGAKASEVTYVAGLKDGLETRFIDGEVVVEEIEWLAGQRHGPSHFYVNDGVETRWFYGNTEVSLVHFEELVAVDQLLAEESNQ